MEVNNSNLCRLCFDEGIINIFNENEQDFIKIIRQHLGCEVHENDMLPKCVCSVCWNRVRSFHSFYEFVKKKQNAFLSELKPETSMRLALNSVHAREQSSSNVITELSASDPVFGEVVAIKTEPVESLLTETENVLADKVYEELGQICETQVKRKVGRPRKITNNYLNNIGLHENSTAKESQSQSEEHNDLVDISERDKLTSPKVVAKRKVGRPRKVQKKSDYEYEVDKMSNEFESDDSCMTGGKRKRGRPKKSKIDDDQELSKIKNKRPRGEQSKSLSIYTLDKDYEAFMLENFNMSCELCSAKDFKCFFDVKTHYSDEHQSNGYVKCCDRKFIYISQVVDHIDYHLNPDVLKCKLCGHRNKSKALLRKHMRLAHEQRHRFKCDICGNTFNRKPHMKMHILRLHVPKNPNIKCEQCDQTFSSIEILKTHQIVVHEKQYNKKRVQCEICGKSINFSRIENHRISHLDKEERWKNRAQCDICGEWFTSASTLKIHKFTHDAPQEECGICHKMFGHKANLNEHIRRMHREREFKCKLCPSAFIRQHQLNLHMESHTKVRQYPCLFCPKIFYVQKSMHIHYSRHHRAEFKEVKRKRRIEYIGGPYFI